MASKRLKLWAVVYPDGEAVVYESEAQAIDEKDNLGLGPSDRLVCLVEHDPRRDAVVRAAVRWSEMNQPHRGMAAAIESDAILRRAVERMKGKKR